MSTTTVDREFSLDELVAIDAMCTRRLTLQRNQQNVPGWEHYLEYFNRKFGWRPSLERILSVETRIRADPTFLYRGAGREWSFDNALGISYISDQESEWFAQQYAEIERVELSSQAERSGGIAQHQAIGQQVMERTEFQHFETGKNPMYQPVL